MTDQTWQTLMSQVAALTDAEFTKLVTEARGADVANQLAASTSNTRPAPTSEVCPWRQLLSGC